MKSYISSLPDRFIKTNQKIDATAILCSTSWLVFNDEGIRQVLIFKKDGTLYVTTNGDVTISKWEYIKANASIVLTVNGKTAMYHPAGYDNALFCLKKDGVEEFTCMADQKTEHLFESLTMKALEDYMPEGVSWTHPDGGLFLWLTFPEYIDSKILLEDCIKRKVAFVPGEPFYAEHPEKNHCRINFSFVDDEKLIEGIKNIAEAVKAYKH